MKILFSVVLIILLTSCSTHTPITQTHQNLSEIGAKSGDPIYIRIFKKEHILELWVKVGKKYKLFNSYKVLRESGRMGPKLKEGDKQNPEGVYKVSKASLKPDSKYHLAINIGYPNIYDRHLGRTGSAIMIHGSNKSIGCFAMGDSGIEKIYKVIEDSLNGGQRSIDIAIFPFIMNDENMKKYDKFASLHAFWKQMQNIYYIFEIERVPPKVIVLENSYLVESSKED
jgi:murein L,D-transpeptidase YafK